MQSFSLGSLRWFIPLTLMCAVALALFGFDGSRLAAAWFRLQQEWKSGLEWPEPVVVTPGNTVGAPPSDAIILFDGKNMSAWNGGEKWKIANGEATVTGSVQTKQKFGDCQLHIEFASPEKVSGSGQGRGNSGVFLMERYEVQILDSYQNKTYFDGQCGSVYKQRPPMVNVSRPPGEWQSFDIIFEAPRFDDAGKVKTPAYITVLHNGVVVQHRHELLGSTAWDEPPQYEQHGEKEPIHLQFHGNPVKFRNIWVREIKPMEPKNAK